MPKKMGVNSKAEAARARKTEAETNKKQQEARAKEDQYWQEAEGPKSRAAKKREEESEKRAEAAARKAEARRLAEQEERELEKSAAKKSEKKANRVAIPVKVTEAELRRRREEETAEAAKKAEERERREKRVAAEEEYERIVSVSNTNREENVIEARSVEEAIEKMSVGEVGVVDKHPERRLKAAFKAFEEAELPRLKEEKPGLTHTQYKDMIWKLWKKSPDNPLNQYYLPCLRDYANAKCYSFLVKWKENKKTVVVGLKSDSRSKQMLLQMLEMVADAGDEVLAVHVQEPFDTFDPNSFHVQEDLSKSKKVDFQVKICRGASFVAELCNQVRDNRATILALGCNISGPKEPLVSAFIKGLPPTCNLVVVDSAGRIRLQKQGTSQQGATSGATQSSQSSSMDETWSNRHITTCHSEKSLVVSKPSQMKNWESTEHRNIKMLNDPTEFQENNLFDRLALSEAKGCGRHFTLQDLRSATSNFSSDMVIGEGGNSKVYRANLVNGNAAAVKVLETTHFADFLREVEILSGIKHKNIVQVIGYCSSEEKPAIVYNLLKGSLSQYLKKLKWSERMGVAIGIAEALDHLHHSLDPPIIHRDVKSSNILLSDDCQPQLSDFGAAIFHHQSEQISLKNITFDVVGTFGYLSPEYVMYGKIDEKLDVYSYGVVLLELITGKDAIQTNQSNCESLVLWARSLFSSGLCERLIDPHLNEDYNKEEMEMMIFTACLCLVHSPSRRPTMDMILKLFKDPKNWMKMRKDRDELLCGMSSKDDSNDDRQDDLSSTATSSTDAAVT